MTITNELLDELEAKAKAATKGQWEHREDYGQVGSVEIAGHVIAQAQQLYPRDAAQRNANAAHIAAANPATLLALVEHIRSQAAELERRKAGQAVPEGYALVPIEPTPEMIAAFAFAGDVDLAIGHGAISAEVASDYKSMLAAAPAAPAQVAQENKPIAIVDANDDGMWADILPDVSVKVGDLLYAAPPAAEQPDSVAVPRELLEELADIADSMQCYDARDDAKALLAGGEA